MWSNMPIAIGNCQLCYKKVYNIIIIN